MINLQEHSTGAMREDKEGKGQPVFLICGFPYTLTQLHKHMENPLGRNWEKGLPTSQFINATFRHLLEELSGNGDEKAAISAVWNLLCYVETKHRVGLGTLPQECDDIDRSKRSEVKYAV